MNALSEAYLNLITSQHRDKPRYMSIMAAFLGHTDDIFSAGIYLDDEFDLEIARGKQEDILGMFVGEERMLDFIPQSGESPVLDNESYRVLLKSRIIKNLWKGGIEDLQDSWEELFNDRIKIRDNQDMTIDILVKDPFDNRLNEAIARGKVFPKPQSVLVTYVFERELEDTLYYASAPTIHTTYEIRPAEITDATAEARRYIGAAVSTHTAYEVYPDIARDAATDARRYIGAAVSTHTAYEVYPEIAQDAAIDSTLYAVGVGSIYKVLEVTQT